MGKEAKTSGDLEKRLKDLSRRAEHEVVPERLRELAARLLDALLTARSSPRHPPEQ